MAQEVELGIHINEEKNGIELKFDSKPSQEVINELKEMNFRWHNQKKMWFARQTSERLEFANRLKEELKPTILIDSYEDDKLTDEEIEAVVLRGSNIVDGKFRIYEQFNKNMSASLNVDFLKNEYGWGGSSSVIPYINISENHDGKGIAILKRGHKADKILLKWPEVEKIIKRLISEDRYLSSEEKEKYHIYLAEKKLKEDRAVIADKFKNLVVDFNEYMEETENREKLLNRYVLSDCASQFTQGNKTTFTLFSNNYIIPLMRDAVNKIIRENTHLTSRCEEMLELLKSDLAKQLDIDSVQDKASTFKNGNIANTFANSYEYIGNDPILAASDISIFNSKFNGCYLSDLNIFFRRYNSNETIVITELENAGVKGKECKKWSINGETLFFDLQDEGINTVKDIYTAISSGKEFENLKIYENSEKGIDVFSPFTEAKPLDKLPDKWTKVNFINALRSGQLFGGEIDSRYTDDYRNDYASNHSEGRRIDMSAAARKEMTDWDKLTSATSGTATNEGIIPVTLYCGNVTKTYFFDVNCDIAEGKRRGEEYINGIERFNRMMEGSCLNLCSDDINPDTIYNLKILSMNNNTGIYGVKDEVIQGYILSERAEEGNISALRYEEYPILDRKIYSVSNFYDRADILLEKDERLIDIGNWENVVTGKALKELIKEKITLPKIRIGPYDGDYDKLRIQIKERIKLGSNFSVKAANYDTALEKLEFEYIRAGTEPGMPLDKMIEEAKSKSQKLNNMSGNNLFKEGGRDNEIL